MLSIRDCLDYCDLTDDEVALVAEHEGIPDGAAAQDKIRWKLGSSYTSNLDVIGQNVKNYVENVKVMSGGNLDIRFFEPGALVPALQVFDAVSAGSAEAAWRRRSRRPWGSIWWKPTSCPTGRPRW